MATVLPAPPFGLTTVTWRSPPKFRRTISMSCRISCSCRPGESRTSPSVLLLTAARTPMVAIGSAGRLARRRANSSAVGVDPSGVQAGSGYAAVGGGGTRVTPAASRYGCCGTSATPGCTSARGWRTPTGGYGAGRDAGGYPGTPGAAG